VKGRGTRAAAALGTLLALAVGSTAAAAGPGSSERVRAHRLNVEAQALDTKAHHALLEVYALDARLGSAQQQLGALEARSAALRAQTAALAQQLGAARATLTVSQQQLGAHLRSLYETGSPDPLAVVLGATSLQDALSKLDSLTRIADQNRQVVEVALSAQSRLARLELALAAQQRRLDQALSATLAAQRQLVAARAARLAYVVSLRAQQRRKQAQVRSLLAAARASELESQQLQAQATPPATSLRGSSPAAPSQPASSPSPVPAQQPASSGGRTITVTATGYSLPGRTATGLPVGWGVVAVDPSLIPLGTKLTIPGYGEGVAADVGSAVHGADIDLWFPTLAQARAWGRRTVTITLH
jgi:3D (Asp-Asp-Asp) domain-containing protein/septal ring factor EnvC (AmiA/AmiB activator)